MTAIERLERRRLELQTKLDGTKSHLERNQLGQFATPPALATEILSYGLTLLGQEPAIRFLDPAIGTGSFFSALLRGADRHRIESSVGFEIDGHYGQPTAELWRDTPLQLHFKDFTTVSPKKDDLANLVICNPPYVRHHHLERMNKLRLQAEAEQQTGVRLSGLSGLYCHFLLLSQRWMSARGIAGWLIPSEFMDVNYGDEVKRFLLSRVTLLHIHRFDPAEVQFDDALVSSAVVWFRNEPPPENHSVRFSFGGTLAEPRRERRIPLDELWTAPKWTQLVSDAESSESQNTLKLGDLFRIQRGLATGSNEFFVLTEKQIEQRALSREFFTPILPSPRYLRVDEVTATKAGVPTIDEPLFLLNCNLPEEVVRTEHPTLWRYFESGINAGVQQRYLCQHRSPWYCQEERKPPPLLCTYMGRTNTAKGRPFRFILNHSQATAANVYLLLYPKPKLERLRREKPQLLRELWGYLNSLPVESLTGEGRVYGGGLHKLEPRELANLPIDASLLNLADVKSSRRCQQALFT